MRKFAACYWEGLKGYFSTLLSVVVTWMVLVGEPTVRGKIIAFILWNGLFALLVAGLVHCRKKLEEQFGKQKN